MTKKATQRIKKRKTTRKVRPPRKVKEPGQARKKIQRKTKRNVRQLTLFEKYAPKKEIIQQANYKSDGNMIPGMRKLLEKIHLLKPNQ